MSGRSIAIKTLAAQLVMITSLMTAYVTSGQASGMQGDAAYNEYRRPGEMTASGERYDPDSMTAASNDLPFDSLVRITRVDNNRTVVVRINDRTAGDEHIIHLSDAASRHIGVTPEMSALIRLESLSGDRLTVVRRPGEQRYGITSGRPSAQQSTSASEPAAESMTAVSSTTAAPVDESTSSVKYTLQVGVFSTQSAAISFAGELSDSWVASITESDDSQYRVYYGRFSVEAQARTAQQFLKRQGRASFLRTLSS